MMALLLRKNSKLLLNHDGLLVPNIFWNDFWIRMYCLFLTTTISQIGVGIVMCMLMVTDRWNDTMPQLPQPLKWEKIQIISATDCVFPSVFYFLVSFYRTEQSSLHRMNITVEDSDKSVCVCFCVHMTLTIFVFLRTTFGKPRCFESGRVWRLDWRKLSTPYERFTDESDLPQHSSNTGGVCMMFRGWGVTMNEIGFFISSPQHFHYSANSLLTWWICDLL